MQTTVKILGGLEVTVEFNVSRADRSVGIMSDYAENWHIIEVANKPCQKAPFWLYKRISETKGEEERIVEACNEAIVAEHNCCYEPEDD